MIFQGLLLIAIGAFAIVCTIKKPAFYWESAKARSMRGLIGDRGAELFYYALGGLLSLMGIGITLGLFNR